MSFRRSTDRNCIISHLSENYNGDSAKNRILCINSENRLAAPVRNHNRKVHTTNETTERHQAAVPEKNGNETD